MDLKLSKILKGIFGFAIAISAITLLVWRFSMQKVTFSMHYTMQGSAYILGILGIVMVAVGICIKMICQRDSGLRYLIIIDYMIATWIYLRSDAVAASFREGMAIRSIKITMVTLLMVPLVLFFDKIQKQRYHKMNMTLLILPVVDWIGCVSVYLVFGIYSEDIFMACQIISIMVMSICVYHLIADYLERHETIIRQVLFATVFVLFGVFAEVFYLWNRQFEWINVLFGYLTFASIVGMFQSVVLSTVRAYLKEQQIRRQTEADSVYRKLHEDARKYLNSIKEENHYLLEHCMEEDIFQAASEVEWHSWQLSSLLHNIENFIAISNGVKQAELEKINMIEVYNAIIEEVLEEAERKKIELNVTLEEDFPREIWGVKYCAMRLLSNLLLYAVESSENDRTISFQTGYFDVGNDTIKIITTVESSGDGMSHEEFKRVQYIFNHLDTVETSELEKMSFGLSTATIFARISGCAMAIENELGKGTRVQVTTVCRVADATPVGEFRDWYVIKETYYQKYRKRIMKKKQEESLNSRIAEKQETQEIYQKPQQDNEGNQEDNRSILTAADIHVADALKYVGDDYRQYVQIMKLFPEKKEEKQKLLEQYYTDKDYLNYTIQVHALKNNARMLGADTLADMAYEHEKAGSQEDESYLNAHYEELLIEWDRVEAVFHCFLEKEAGESKQKKENDDLPVISEEQWREKVKEILECLELFQKKETLELLEKLREFQLTQEQLQVVDDATEAVKKYDYDGAIEQLEEGCSV